MSRPAIRWLLYGVALVLTLVWVRLVEQPGSRAAVANARADPRPPPVNAAPTPGAAAAPVLQLELLASRTRREPDTDPFNARAWESLAADEARRNAPPPPPPLPPQAPPLPFTFMGKLTDADQVTVFLTNGNRNWVVRAGDTIDGAYRVDAIADDRITLTYLALQIPQELSIGERIVPPGAGYTASTAEALPSDEAKRASAPIPGQVPLLFAAPSRVMTGDELTVNLGLPPGSEASAARVELAYDAKVLAAVNPPSRDTGRVTVELASGPAPLAQVRFRAIAQGPTTTRIGIESVVATNSRGVNVSVAPPVGHSVAIVPSGG